MDVALALISIAIGCYMMIAADRIIISAGRRRPPVPNVCRMEEILKYDRTNK